MRRVLLILWALVSISCSDQENMNLISEDNPSNSELIMNDPGEVTYDSNYAQKVGADDYGMKNFVMALLYRGANRPDDQNLIDSLQAEHLSNIHKLAEEGKLVLAGPFLGDDDLRGIYIFNTESIEEAEAWTSTDPAIIYGSLKMDLKQWYGSAALMDVNELHNKAAKIRF